MQTGTYISGAGHLALIAWAFLGGVFRSGPLPFEVQEVAVISTSEFEAILAAQEPPDTVTEPAALTPPEENAPPPDVAPEPDPEPERVTPETTEATPPDETPVETPAPVPPADIADDAPELTPPGSEVAVALPPGDRPQPRPSERIAPEAVAPPDPEAAPDEVERDAVVPEDGETDTPQEPQEATAPEEAAPEIVTEAEEPAGAPLRSIRPATRPSRPVASPPAEETETAVDEAVAAALRDNTQPQTPRAPSGPPLSAGERDALRVSVQNCWNVGSLSSAAQETVVVVGVDMQEDGRPISGSIRMLSFSGGTEASAKQAFEAARRAIIRCGARGFPLPAEKYDHWREIEMTFNPEKMRIR